MSTLSPFGEQLRFCRRQRGLSQLDLALAAGTTSRYVSFVETGRSRPGRGVVLRLAQAMDLPLRESNALLRAAGLPPAYPESRLDEARMATVRRVVDELLARHEPYPAVLLGADNRVLRQNRSAERHFPGLADLEPEELARAFVLDRAAVARAEGPVLPITLSLGGQAVRVIMALFRFENPADVTTAEMKVELFYPADAQAEAFFRE